MTIGGYIMYKPTKRAWIVGLSAGLIIAGAGANINAQAGQSYDSSNVGISNRVGEYIKSGKESDPVAKLTNGLASVSDSVVSKKKASEDEGIDLIDASLTDAKEYPQFKGRAVVTTEDNVNIRTKDNTDSEVVGTLARGGICLVKEIGKEWTKVASGSCEGYIANEFLAYGDDAGKWCDENGVGRTATVCTATLKVREDKDEKSDCLTLIPEGEAYYVYSVSGEWTEVSIDDDIRGFVRSEFVDVKYDNPRAISVEEQEEMDRIAQEEADKAWLKYLEEQEALEAEQSAQAEEDNQDQTEVAEADTDTETGIPEGEVESQQTADEPGVEGEAETETETETETAEETQEAETETETEAAAPEASEETEVAAPAGSTGVDLVNFALQFVGNPYVWGGTSLTNGADCSGFVQSVYAEFGYSLPRTADVQAGCGVEVSLSDLQPGDLLFYWDGYEIGHVAIYAGDGVVVHASNSRDGIKTSPFNYRTPCKACRIIGQ